MSSEVDLKLTQTSSRSGNNNYVDSPNVQAEKARVKSLDRGTVVRSPLDLSENIKPLAKSLEEPSSKWKKAIKVNYLLYLFDILYD